MQFPLFIHQIKQRPWLAEALAALAGIAYFIQTWQYSQTRDSVLDEGLYLLKGYLFVSGEYQPFQANGVLTNHMPLSFLIPGFFQYIFGPGLQTGRIYAVVIGLLFVLGTWILVHRLGGRWWAAVVVLTLAMNPMMIKVYSLAVAQGLGACLLVWTLVFGLDSGRRPGYILLGSFFAGMLFMTRLNLAAVFIFLLVYIFTRHGFRLGILAVAVGMTPILWGHIQFYPEIMVLWVKWFPPELTPFFSQWRFPGMNQIPDTGITAMVRLKGFFQGFTRHFLPWMAILVSWFFWSKKLEKENLRNGVFFSSLYAFLFAIHAWATLGGDHCVFCFSWYQYFFEILAILVIVVTWRGWRLVINSWRKTLGWVLILTVVCGLIFGYAFQLGTGPSTRFGWMVESIMNLRVPRLVNWRFESGQIEFWGLIANKFGLLSRYPYEVAYWMVENSLRVFLSLVFSGLVLWTLWGIAGWLRVRFLEMPTSRLRADRSALVMILVLVGGWILTPTGLLGNNRDSYDCGFNIIDTYESAGRQLDEQIPPGSKVFWRGGDTQAALLYLEEVEFFPALFNASFANREGDPVELEKHGLWNDELIWQWANEADFILIEARNYGGWLAEYVTSEEFNELEPTGEMGCRGGTSLHVYMRLP